MTPPSIPPSLSSAVQALAQGNQTEAKEICLQHLQESPEHPQALLILGIIAYQSDDHSEAVNQMKRAIAANPGFIDGYLNLGNIYREHEQWAEAEACFRQVLIRQPEHTLALLSLAKVLTASGQLEEAMAAFGKLLSFTPDDPEVHFNLGLAFARANDTEQALQAFNNALSLKPDFPQALNELGLMHLDQGDCEQAQTCFEKALELAPEDAKQINHLGLTNKDFGQLDIALENFRQSLSRTPDDPVVFDYILRALHGLCFDVLTKGNNPSDIDDTIATLPTAPEPDIVSFACAAVLGRDQLKAWDRLIQNFPSAPSLANPQILHENPPPEPTMITALLHLGRSGTGYLHSLVDTHPQVSTLPGVYFSGFFGRDVWSRIGANGFEGMVENFCQLYEVLFDARCPEGIPPAYVTDKYTNENVGFREGFLEMGEHRDTPLTLDRRIFADNLQQFVTGYETITQGQFFYAVHQAYERTLGRNGKTNLFYHLHKIDPYCLCRYLQEFPNSQFLMMVRNPLQSCKSWALPVKDDAEVKPAHKLHDNIIGKIGAMLLSLDAPVFRTHKAAGLRLEDLREIPEQTTRHLTAFLEIEEAPSLYQSTMQGLKWWGDPSSSLYGRTHDTIDPEDDPLARKPGRLFSEQDQFILATLFHPFSARFGYADDDEAKFQSDLKVIRPLLEAPMDFEKELSATFPGNYPALETTGNFKAFHAVLLGRWKILNEFGTYPGMLAPIGG